MAMFQQHLNGAVLVSGVLTSVLYSSEFLTSTTEALVVFGLGTLGGLLPDIDSDNSRPTQITFNILSIIFPFIVLLGLKADLTVFEYLMAWTISSTLLYAFFYLFLRFTIHRGIFHSIPMGILFGLSIYYIFSQFLGYSQSFSLISGIFLFMGYLTHLLLDEIVSLNAFGLSIKKSFGTAMKLYEKNNLIGSILVYTLIIILLFFNPIDMSTLSEISQTLSQIKLV
jgi:hypothetical protein